MEETIRQYEADGRYQAAWDAVDGIHTGHAAADVWARLDIEGATFEEHGADAVDMLRAAWVRGYVERRGY